MFDTILTTDRLILRPFRMEDVEASFQMENDPAVVRYTHDGGIKSREEVTALIRTLIDIDYGQNGFGRFAVELKSTGAFVGFAGLKRIDPDTVDLGYRLRSDLWGMGLATESGRACLDWGFDELGLREIEATVLPDNMGSIRVLEKLGFQFSAQVEEDGLTARRYLCTKDGMQ